MTPEFKRTFPFHKDDLSIFALETEYNHQLKSWTQLDDRLKAIVLDPKAPTGRDLPMIPAADPLFAHDRFRYLRGRRVVRNHIELNNLALYREASEDSLSAGEQTLLENAARLQWWYDEMLRHARAYESSGAPALAGQLGEAGDAINRIVDKLVALTARSPRAIAAKARVLCRYPQHAGKAIDDFEAFAKRAMPRPSNPTIINRFSDSARDWVRGLARMTH